MIYQIPQPDFSKISPKRWDFLQKNFFDIILSNGLEKYADTEYLHWEKIRFKKPLPPDLENNEELWMIIKLFRFWGATPINNKSNKKFKLWKPNFLEALLHNLDLSLGGNFLGIEFNNIERRDFLQNWITEEAISSSQIEGAMTTSKIAREMIKQSRKPNGSDETMIYNNYKAMKWVQEDLKNEKMSREILLELQIMLTKWTDIPKDYIGRFRKDDDEIVVDDGFGEILFETPKEEFFQKELDRLIEYANDENEKHFTHPFIKACILHFWIAYLHPFCDWNGRTARVIFYWYLLKKWYWGFSYIPLSRIIKETKNKYSKSYIYSEQDDNDLTYFVVYMANITEQAIKEFQEYITKKRDKQKSIKKIVGLNDRQTKLLHYFINHPETFVNNVTHKNYYVISINTAKRDLEDLLEKWFLKKEKIGKYVNYYPVEQLKELL